ncbi:hypothetical protein BD413DRAFT_490094 [Trametes elegans]|nr:hypothetical protein BD413DRAFT_490094 [Trametes elegans]
MRADLRRGPAPASMFLATVPRVEKGASLELQNRADSTRFSVSTTETYILKRFMSQNEGFTSITTSLAHHVVPDPPTGAPYLPSPVETKYYLYGLPSEARMIARSSADVWMPPTGAEAYLKPKELAILGAHSLNGVWDDVVGPAMEAYLADQQVQCSIMHPVRLGVVDQTPDTFPAFVMIGVDHDPSILVGHEIEDVYVIVYESKYQFLAGLYKPAVISNPIAIVREPFSTTLGISICNAATPNFEGTGGFFFIDTAKPGKLFLLTARHVLFHPTRNQRRSTASAKAMAVPSAAIGAKEIVLEQLARRLERANDLDEQEANDERDEVEALTKAASKAIEAFKKLLTDIGRDWTDEENRVIGHVTLSPPISFNHVDGGFTEDWAVVELLPSTISKLNFVGNAIDLGSVAVDELTAWMHPQLANPSAFKYPGDRLLHLCGTVSDDEMYKPDPKTKDQDNDPAIMVLKNGNTTKFTVGRLNTIRAFTRTYFEGNPGAMSKEIAVLPRSSKSGPFSAKGDSGSGVIDGKGRVCGLLTGGDGATDVSDCTFLTSINFLVKRPVPISFPSPRTCKEGRAPAAKDKALVAGIEHPDSDKYIVRTECKCFIRRA